jgi:phage head maturation protease
MQLPAYIQHVAHELIGQGHDESRAIEMAVGIVKNWAAGHDGHGHHVHPDVQAAAAKNIAEWEALKAKAHASTGARRSTVTARAELTTQSINDLPDSDFAYIQPGGTKDSSGKTVPRSLRHFPIHDAAHARNALARAPQSPFGKQAMPKILAACKKFGIDVAADSGSGSGRAESLSPYMRSFPLEDISVSTTRDGRIVDAYLAVFNTPAPIRDQDGEYEEDLDPVVFNRAISDARPQGARTSWRIGVFYNHAMNIHGQPSDLFSMPIAAPMDIKTDGHGVRATDKYHRSQLCDEIIEGLESGAIPGYSFSGRFLRSRPLIPRGGFRRDPAGNLQRVRRVESTLKEYGPTPFPAYTDAAVLGVRSDSLMAAMMADPELAVRMLTAFRDGAPMDSPPLFDGAPDVGLAAGDSPAYGRSVRSVRQQMTAARAAFLLRHRME